MYQNRVSTGFIIILIIVGIACIYLLSMKEKMYSQARDSIKKVQEKHLSLDTTLLELDTLKQIEQINTKTVFDETTNTLFSDIKKLIPVTDIPLNNPETTRVRFAEINTTLLDTVKKNLEAKSDTHQVITLNLFQDRIFPVVMEKIEKNENEYALSGSIESGDTKSAVTLTVEKERIQGFVAPVSFGNNRPKTLPIHITTSDDHTPYAKISEVNPSVQ